MNNSVKVVVKDFVVMDRHFVICKRADGWYLAIEDKYIDENGRLNTALNGLQMNAGRTLDKCLETCKNNVMFEYYRKKGLSDVDALNKVYNFR